MLFIISEQTWFQDNNTMMRVIHIILEVDNFRDKYSEPL